MEGTSKGSPNQPTNQSRTDVWPGLEFLQGWRWNNLFWEPFPMPVCPHGEKFSRLIKFEPFTFQMLIVSSPLAMHNCENNLYGELVAFSKASSSPCWTSLVSASFSHGVSQAPDYSSGLLAEFYFFHCPSCMGGIHSRYDIPDAVYWMLNKGSYSLPWGLLAVLPGCCCLFLLPELTAGSCSSCRLARSQILSSRVAPQHSSQIVLLQRLVPLLFPWSVL